ALRATGADFALSVTGYAGPDGGTERDPVGTVYMGVANKSGAEVRRFNFFGDRERIRMMASQWGLDWLRRKVISESGSNVGSQ
ncbi:MAG TPA: CinA family protein, partial [Bryobacteraceae bacterium]|nr:CinA family protein [Bryobacteraceae bacterium]